MKKIPKLFQPPTMLKLMLVSCALSATAQDMSFTIGSNIIVPSSNHDGQNPYTANVWIIYGDEYDGTDNIIVGTPPNDANGNPWYALDYQLTNGDDVLPDEENTPVVWEERQSPFWDNYLPDNRIGDIYLRRSFTFEPGTVLPNNLYLSASFDDSPAEYYINGVLIFAETGTEVWYDGYHEVLLTDEQKAAIKTDGSENIIAAHASQNWGGHHIDCGLYDDESMTYIIIDQEAKEVAIKGSPFVSGDYEIPSIVEHDGVKYTVVRIGEYAFYSGQITSVIVPSTIKEIEYMAFSDNSNLISVTLNEGLETIGWDAFGDCYNLKELYFPNSLQSCDNCVWAQDKIKVSSPIAVWDFYCSALVAAPRTAVEYEVKDGTQSIGAYAFASSPDLVKVTLPASCAEINDYAFQNCLYQA